MKTGRDTHYCVFAWFWCAGCGEVALKIDTLLHDHPVATASGRSVPWMRLSNAITMPLSFHTLGLARELTLTARAENLITLLEFQ